MCSFFFASPPPGRGINPLGLLQKQFVRIRYAKSGTFLSDRRFQRFRIVFCSFFLERLAFSFTAAFFLCPNPAAAVGDGPARASQAARCGLPSRHAEIWDTTELCQRLYKMKEKRKNLKKGLDTGGGYGIIGTQRKGPSFEPVLGLYLLYTIRRKNSL